MRASEIMTIGDYAYRFVGYKLTKDDYGTDVVLLTYCFTNNSTEACTFADAAFYEALQNGNDLNSTTIYVSEESMETITKNEYEEIEPGAVIEVVIAYELYDTASPVKVSFTGSGNNSEASHTININSEFEEDASSTDSKAKNDKSDVNIVADIFGIVGSKWYGRWELTDATGNYEKDDGAYYDCCAAFEPTKDGYILMRIWDEKHPDCERNRLGELRLKKFGDMGFSSVSGCFLTEDDIGAEGNVMVIPGIFEIENTLFTTIPVETEGGGFTAAVFLTRWGCEWNENFGEYPAYYSSYFLPMIKDGKELPTNLDDIG